MTFEAKLKMVCQDYDKVNMNKVVDWKGVEVYKHYLKSKKLFDYQFTQKDVRHHIINKG